MGGLYLIILIVEQCQAAAYKRGVCVLKCVGHFDHLGHVLLINGGGL